MFGITKAALVSSVIGFCGLVFSVGALAEIPAGSKIPICNDSGEWPPYFYWERQNGSQTDNLLGYDIDVLNEIMANNGFEYSFELIAWSRCLLEVERGNDYAMLTSAAYSDERNEKYLISEDYYTVQPHYFYHQANFPDGLDIQNLEEFKNYKVCGLRGYNYTNFGVDVGTIDTGTRHFPQLIEKTRRKRCDLFLGRYEIFAGFAKTGNDYIRKHNLGTAPMPGVAGDKFYMMVSRNYPYSDDLVALLNSAINELKNSGRDQKLLAPYLN